MLAKQFPAQLLRRTLIVLALLAPGLAATAADQSSAAGPQNRLAALLQPKPDRLLEPEQAFRLKTRFKSPTVLVAELMPAEGYYLYRDRIRFALRDAGGVTIRALRLPSGKNKKDPTFGATEVYEQPILAEITLDRTTAARQLTLLASYQGCHDKTGVCYPPVNTALTLALPAMK